MEIAIVGGTGTQGFGLALRLTKAGHHVTIGSRSAEKAAASVQEAKAILGPDAPIDGAESAASVAGKPVVLVTVPFVGQAESYRSIAHALEEGTVICDCTVPSMTAVGGRATHAIVPWHGSAVEFARTLVPRHVRIVGAFHTVSGRTLRDLDHPLESDALVMGDDAEAKALIGGLIEDLPGMRWVDVGGLQMARIAETLGPLLISVNVQYQVHNAGFRITGRDTWGVPGA